jgi:uncharacterized membrane protein YdbT with pleckstrin-like domain
MFPRPMELHPDEKVIFEGHPSWRATLGFYLKGLAVAVLAAGIAALITAIGDGVDGAVVGLVALIALALVVVAGLLKRMATVYSITNQRLRIKRGIVARKIQQTRIDRVQNVNTDQSVLERLLRVGTVDFDTAGTDDSEFRFVGVSSPGEVVEAVERAQAEQPRDAGLGDAPPAAEPPSA